MIVETKTPAKVAVLGGDYVGLKPTMAVRVADKVRLGQLLFTDKTTPGVRYTSPGAGKVMAIHRGPRRALLSVVIQLAGSSEETFQSYAQGKLASLKTAKSFLKATFLSLQQPVADQYENH